ncbi:T9SS type A sorting domain-containing protein [Aquimarina sp. RZ0]|uniref:T9SS type A sorting domain-containing protein n=1 Tax=Aquimarina sp. RZ0 TaxID=2607730 RepID=UPI0011F21264|nr:T9SS type A sorting domain-containing protein [Aquimarina sp. RZ0]KAA1245011.1 T9SS type A sorting domain-containing protein [Aquimarina sp. RZ0]
MNGIKGSIYATWVRPRNFNEIAPFGALWWQGKDTSTDISGKFWRIENKASRQRIRTRNCSGNNSQIAPLVQTTINNTGNCTMFEFIPTDDGYYFIQNKATNGRYRPKNCSTITNDSVEIVQVGSSSFGWCEQWKLVETTEKGYFRIQNRQTGGWIRSQGCSGIGDDSVPITQVSTGYTGNCTQWKLIRATEKDRAPEENSTAIQVYPNPADNQFIIEAPNALEDIQHIRIYDIQGRLTKSITKDFIDSTNVSLDTQTLAEGMYLLSVNFSNKETQNFQFIVKH